MPPVPKLPPRIDSEKHRRFVSEHWCVVCMEGQIVWAGHTVSQCAHNRIGFFMKGKRPCDSKTVPLCPGHHQIDNAAQHNSNEAEWWTKHGIDPFEISRELAANSPDAKIRETVK